MVEFLDATGFFFLNNIVIVIEGMEVVMEAEAESWQSKEDL